MLVATEALGRGRARLRRRAASTSRWSPRSWPRECPADSILVVHNPAEPGEPAPAAPPGCEVLQAERNLGYAGGMNLGIARLRERGAGPPLLLLLTHDARLREGALGALLEASRRSPGSGFSALPWF